MPQPLYAILVDGGFITKKLYQRLGRHATADDIQEVCKDISSIDQVRSYELLRIYYYDAPPSSVSLRKPVTGDKFDLAATERFRLSQSLHDQLVMKPHFALRMGETVLSPQNWKMKPREQKKIIKAPRALTDDDFTLDISQKGVDLRIGLDMARLALRELVRAVIVITGDSDFVPAFKFVRREGVKVILQPLGHGVRRELKAHADVVL